MSCEALLAHYRAIKADGRVTPEELTELVKQLVHTAILASASETLRDSQSVALAATRVGGYLSKMFPAAIAWPVKWIAWAPGISSASLVVHAAIYALTEFALDRWQLLKSGNTKDARIAELIRENAELKCELAEVHGSAIKTSRSAAYEESPP